MSEQATAISEHEAAHAPHADHGGGAADPPSGMHEWWKTPASLIRKPVAVDPAIYGIDASDVGGDVSGNAAAVAEIFAQVARDHVGPASLDAYIGIEGAGSAQAAPQAPLSRADHMKAGEGGRAEVMSTQLMMAAKKIEGSIQQIHDTLAAPIGARSADGVVSHLETLVAAATAERERIMLVVREQQRAALKVPMVREGLIHIDRASHQLTDAVLKVKAFASRHNVPLDAKKLGGTGVKDDVERLMTVMQTEVDSAGVANVKTSDTDLQLVSLKRSLDAVDEGTQALVLSVNEATPDEKIREVLPTLLSSLRLLQASLVKGVHPTPDMLKTGTRIKFAVKKAWLDGQPSGLQGDSSFKMAHEEVLAAMGMLETLDKGKKK